MQLKTFEDMKKTSAFFMLKPVNAIYGFIITVCVVIFAILIWAIFSPMDDVVKATNRAIDFCVSYLKIPVWKIFAYTSPPF